MTGPAGLSGSSSSLLCPGNCYQGIEFIDEVVEQHPAVFEHRAINQHADVGLPAIAPHSDVEPGAVEDLAGGIPVDKLPMVEIQRLLRPGHIGQQHVVEETYASSLAVYHLAQHREAPGRHNLHYGIDVGAGLLDLLDVLLHLHVRLVTSPKSLERVGDIATQPAEVLGHVIA